MMALGITDEKIKTLNSFIEESSRIVIVTHSRPDGDALGSTTALKRYLTCKRGKKAEVIVPNGFGRELFFISEGQVLIYETESEACIKTIGESDLMFCLDFNGFGRTDALGEPLKAASCRKVLIDHHISPSVEDFDLVFSVEEISSTCELLFQILMLMPDIQGDAKALPDKCGRSLMTGMTTDTNNFANSVYPGTLKMASALLEAGVNRDDIIDRLYHQYRENRIRVFAFLLGKVLTITPEGVAYIILDSDVWNEYQLEQGETEGLVNVPLSMAKVKMSIFLRQDGEQFRVSIRSKKGVSANQFARLHFNGGGHELAAGGKLRWPEDISGKDEAENYVKRVSAQFMKEITEQL